VAATSSISPLSWEENRCTCAVVSCSSMVLKDWSITDWVIKLRKTRKITRVSTRISRDRVRIFIKKLTPQFVQDYFSRIKSTPVRTQVAARIKKIIIKRKFLDNPAATEKNSAVIKQLTPSILLEKTDRRSMVNKDHFVVIVHISSHLSNIENHIQTISRFYFLQPGKGVDFPIVVLSKNCPGIHHMHLLTPDC
jgi:hypothetical protein